MGETRTPVSARASELGFSLVELLVVMMLLAILVALAVPSFLTQTDKADDSDAQNAARTAVGAIEAWAIDNDSDYSGVDVGAIQAIEPTLQGANIVLSGIAAKQFTVRAISTGARWFEITRQGSGEMRRDCGPAGEGACRDDGSWG